MSHLMLLLYIYGQIDNWQEFFCVIAVLSGFALAIWFYFMAQEVYSMYNIFCPSGSCGRDKSKPCDHEIEYSTKMKFYLKIGKAFFIIFSIFLFITLSIPSSGTFASMVLVPYLAKNEQTQKLPDNILKTANDAMEALQKKLQTTGEN